MLLIKYYEDAKDISQEVFVKITDFHTEINTLIYSPL